MAKQYSFKSEKYKGYSLQEYAHDQNFDNYFQFALESNFSNPIPLAKEIIDLLSLAVHKSGMEETQKQTFWDEMMKHSQAQSVMNKSEIK